MIQRAKTTFQMWRNNISIIRPQIKLIASARYSRSRSLRKASEVNKKTKTTIVKRLLRDTIISCYGRIIMIIFRSQIILIIFCVQIYVDLPFLFTNINVFFCCSFGLFTISPPMVIAEPIVILCRSAARHVMCFSLVFWLWAMVSYVWMDSESLPALLTP